MRYVALVAVIVVGWFTVGPGELSAEASPERNPAAQSPPSGHAACPVPAGRVSSGYGTRWGVLHDGVDLAAPIGTPIRAVLGGTVTFSAKANPKGYGQYITITNAAGRQQYGHMSKRLVAKGDRVRAGQVIARVGAEGVSTGPHLHLRIYKPGKTTGTDPVPWLKDRGVRLPCR